MKPKNRDETLLEQGLAAWDVPEPPPGLTDRILAQNAETLTALSTPPTPTPAPPEPPALEPEPPALKEDGPAVQPSPLRTETSMRPFWTATALGFAAAAAIVLAFMAGRQSTTLPAAAPVTPIVPVVEIQVTAPAPLAQPPAPPTLPEKTIISETSEPVPPPPKVREVRDPIGLKNPFRSRKGPSRPRKPGSDKGPSRSRKPGNATGLFTPFPKNPFAAGEATLRLGTNAGSAPAEVSVDGKPVGKTPIASLKVSPGQHTVVFRWPSKRRSFTIDVEADEVRVVRADDK